MIKTKYNNGEGTFFDIEARLYEEFHGITLCCVIMNEENIIKEFLEYYKPHVDSICLIDGGSTDKTVDIALPVVDHLTVYPFDGHYSNQANRVVQIARTDWILLIDADERLEEKVLCNLGKLIDQDEYDCYAFPRKEIIDGKIDKSIYPDYQDRLYRSYCRRIRPVHGEVVGFHKKNKLPQAEGYHIIHNKNKDRHESRNMGYGIFEINFAHEMGAPGAQTKATYEKKYPHLLQGEAEKRK